jgi:zinc/manganese transport system substrate-binding protein
MKNYIILLSIFLSSPLLAKINVFTCEPEWASLTKEIAKDKVNIVSATTAKQDPHHIQAKPSLIAAFRNSNLAICTGAELEEGWLPAVINKSGNYKIKMFMPANVVELLGDKEIYDRKHGHLHPSGNPHMHLNPYHILTAALYIKEELVELDPNNKDFYENNYKIFVNKWNDNIKKWEQKSTKIKGMRVISHHSEFIYLADWLGMDIVTNLEEKPGITPSTNYLDLVLTQINKKNSNIKLIIRSPFSYDKPSIFVSNKSNVPNIILPYTIEADEPIEKLFDDIINILIQYNN